MIKKKRKAGFNRALFDQILFDGFLEILVVSLPRKKTNLLTEGGKTDLSTKLRGTRLVTKTKKNNQTSEVLLTQHESS